MKRIISIFLLVISSLSLYSTNRFALPFLIKNYSVYESSFGLNSGTANLRNLSPLAVQNNPAKLGAFKGFSLGYQHQGDSGWSITTTQAVLNYKGVGISFPAYGIGSGSVNKHRATLMDIEDYNGLFTPKEYHKEFGIGTDLLQLWDQIRKSTPDEQRNLKLYMGSSLNLIYQKLTPEAIEALPETKENDNTAFVNLGLIAEFTPIKLAGRNKLRSTFGVQFINLNKAVLKPEPHLEDKLPYGAKIGFSSTFSVLDKTGSAFTKNALVLHMMGDFAHYVDYKDVFGFGGEVTVFDIASVRFGYTKDSLENESALTNGFGISTNYKDKYLFSFNLINELGEGTLFVRKRADFTVGYNF